MTVPEFAQAVYTYGTATHASVTSWGRTVEHSIAVGGFQGDPHTHWLGADLVYDDPLAFSPVVRGQVAQSLGLEIVFETDHDHLQPAGWANHWP